MRHPFAKSLTDMPCGRMVRRLVCTATPEVSNHSMPTDTY